jgi:autotransporter-associated beta strand protein
VNPANIYTLGGNSADVSTFSGTINCGESGKIAENLTVTAVSGGQVNFTGNLVRVGNGTADVLTKTGAGIVVLSGTNSLQGGTVINTGTLIARNASALNSTTGGAVTVAAGAALDYFAAVNAQLGLHSTLTITGGAGTTIGGSIGSTTTSAEINVTGAATISDGALTVNIYGVNGVAPSTGTYTLIHGGVGSSLNPATAPTLGLVYNNTNFTVGGFTRSATDLQVGITSATALTTAFWKGGLSGATNVWAASNGSTASNWTTTAGGSVQGLVAGSGTDVTISATSPATPPTATVLGANMNIKSLTIADTANGLTLNADGYTLTINPGTGGTGILVSAGVPASTVAANVAMGSSQTWTINSASPLTVSGIVSESGGNRTMEKSGAGTLVLSGANTYTGGTTVTGGTLLVNNGTGSGTGTGNVTVNGGTLGGSGTISGGVTINSGGTLAPGNSPGLLTVGSLVLNAGSATVFEVAGSTTRGGDYDAINVVTSGGLTLNGNFTIGFTNVSALDNTTNINLFQYTGSHAGNFMSLVSTGFYAGTWVSGGADIFTLSSGGQTLTFSELTGSLTVIPEPAIWALLAFSLTIFMVMRRRAARN